MFLIVAHIYVHLRMHNFTHICMYVYTQYTCTHSYLTYTHAHITYLKRGGHVKKVFPILVSNGQMNGEIL